MFSLICFRAWEMIDNICPRCLYLKLNLSDNELLRKPENQIRKTLSERWPSLISNKSDNEVLCHFCLGMLGDPFLQTCVEDISREVHSQHYKCSSFKLMISQPVQLLLFSRHFNDRYHDVVYTQRRSGKALEIKDLMKIYLEPRLEESLQLKAIPKDSADLEIVAVIKHDESEKYLLPRVENHVPKCFEKARKLNERLEKKRRREELTVFNLTTVNDALKCLNSEELSVMLTENYYSHPVNLCKVSTLRMPIFLAGRYCKYSRDLSQTPWFLDGRRKSETSVEEFIAVPIKTHLCADEYSFSSSGREDIDVRMLGNGRPFLLEVLNAREFSSEVNMVQLQNVINEGTDLIKVRDLQLVEKEDAKNLKDGEEAKTKSYSSVCYIKLDPKNIEQSQLALLQKFKELSNMKDIRIEQKTPLRVLHRRNLTTRTRLIYSLKAELISPGDASEGIAIPPSVPSHYVFFRLYMTTQAGTYVKEFVHGDFGRTVPNVQSLLGLDADILSLDVTAVNLDWPPML